MTKPNDSNESRMLQRVRAWRTQAFEARQTGDASEQTRRTQELLRRFGLKLATAPPKRVPRRDSAA